MVTYRPAMKVPVFNLLTFNHPITQSPISPMRILFSPAERQHFTFQESPRRPLSSAYLEAREKVWQQKLDDAHVRGLELWNGEIYVIERFIQTDESDLVIELSTCEYKDITFTSHHTIQGIVRDYGADHLHPYITINGIPVTEDGRCVFGLRSAHIFASDNMIGLIGGTANKDEMPINALDEVRRFMHMEMQEETRLIYDERDLTLLGLHHYRGKYEFLYTIRLPITADRLSA